MRLPELDGPSFLRAPAKAVLAPAGRTSALTRLAADEKENEAEWGSFRPPPTSRRSASKPGAEDLLEAEFGGRTEPLLVAQRYGLGHAYVLATGGTWRWQMQLPHEDQRHETFWRQLLQAAATTAPQPVTLTSERVFYGDESTVLLRAEVRDKNYQPASDAAVTLEVSDGLGRRHGRDDTCRGRARSLSKPPTRRRTPACSASKRWPRPRDEELGRARFAVRREDGVIEHYRVAQNRPLLERLAAATGGTYFAVDDVSRLPEAVSFSEAGSVERQVLDLWNIPHRVHAADVAEGGEWLVRLYWGRCEGAGGAAVLAALGATAAGACRALLPHRRRPRRRGHLRGAIREGCRRSRGGGATHDCREPRHAAARRGRDARRAREQPRFAATRAKAADNVVVMLVGHGSYDGEAYKLNLPGPDVDGDEVAKLFAAVPARSQLVVNTTSASGAVLEKWAAEGRTLITATRSGFERNATRFAQHFAAALAAGSADINKNGAITAQEAFDYASRSVAESFEKDGASPPSTRRSRAGQPAASRSHDWRRPARLSRRRRPIRPCAADRRTRAARRRDRALRARRESMAATPTSPSCRSCSSSSPTCRARSTPRSRGRSSDDSRLAGALAALCAASTARTV